MPAGMRKWRPLGLLEDALDDEDDGTPPLPGLLALPREPIDTENIDLQTGAPPDVREFVGGAGASFDSSRFAGDAITEAHKYPSYQSAAEFDREMPEAPPDVDINRNIDEALRHRYNDIWFYNKVRNKGPWDYKQQGEKLREFGNFNYGATGAAMGYSVDTLLRMAGWAQARAGTSKPEWGEAPNLIEAYLGKGGRAPFGDDPDDRKWIIRGIQYYRERR